MKYSSSATYVTSVCIIWLYMYTLYTIFFWTTISLSLSLSLSLNIWTFFSLFHWFPKYRTYHIEPDPKFHHHAAAVSVKSEGREPNNRFDWNRLAASCWSRDFSGRIVVIGTFGGYSSHGLFVLRKNNMDGDRSEALESPVSNPAELLCTQYEGILELRGEWSYWNIHVSSDHYWCAKTAGDCCDYTYTGWIKWEDGEIYTPTSLVGICDRDKFRGNFWK